jgi:hypothetical protein
MNDGAKCIYASYISALRYLPYPPSRVRPYFLVMFTTPRIFDTTHLLARIFPATSGSMKFAFVLCCLQWWLAEARWVTVLREDGVLKTCVLACVGEFVHLCRLGRAWHGRALRVASRRPVSRTICTRSRSASLASARVCAYPRRKGGACNSMISNGGRFG